jgi:hypothetical protein
MSKNGGGFPNNPSHAVASATNQSSNPALSPLTRSSAAAPLKARAPTNALPPKVAATATRPSEKIVDKAGIGKENQEEGRSRVTPARKEGKRKERNEAEENRNGTGLGRKEVLRTGNGEAIERKRNESERNGAGGGRNEVLRAGEREGVERNGKEKERNGAKRAEAEGQNKSDEVFRAKDGQGVERSRKGTERVGERNERKRAEDATEWNGMEDAGRNTERQRREAEGTEKQRKEGDQERKARGLGEGREPERNIGGRKTEEQNGTAAKRQNRVEAEGEEKRERAERKEEEGSESKGNPDGAEGKGRPNQVQVAGEKKGLSEAELLQGLAMFGVRIVEGPKGSTDSKEKLAETRLEEVLIAGSKETDSTMDERGGSKGAGLPSKISSAKLKSFDNVETGPSSGMESGHKVDLERAQKGESAKAKLTEDELKAGLKAASAKTGERSKLRIEKSEACGLDVLGGKERGLEGGLGGPGKRSAVEVKTGLGMEGGQKEGSRPEKRAGSDGLDWSEKRQKVGDQATSGRRGVGSRGDVRAAVELNEIGKSHVAAAGRSEEAGKTHVAAVGRTDESGKRHVAAGESGDKRRGSEAAKNEGRVGGHVDVSRKSGRQEESGVEVSGVKRPRDPKADETGLGRKRQREGEAGVSGFRRPREPNPDGEASGFTKSRTSEGGGGVSRVKQTRSEEKEGRGLGDKQPGGRRAPVGVSGVKPNNQMWTNRPAERESEQSEVKKKIFEGCFQLSAQERKVRASSFRSGVLRDARIG